MATSTLSGRGAWNTRTDGEHRIFAAGALPASIIAPMSPWRTACPKSALKSWRAARRDARCVTWQASDVPHGNACSMEKYENLNRYRYSISSGTSGKAGADLAGTGVGSQVAWDLVKVGFGLVAG